MVVSWSVCRSTIESVGPYVVSDELQVLPSALARVLDSISEARAPIRILKLHCGRKSGMSSTELSASYLTSLGGA